MAVAEIRFNRLRRLASQPFLPRAIADRSSNPPCPNEPNKNRSRVSLNRSLWSGERIFISSSNLNPHHPSPAARLRTPIRLRDRLRRFRLNLSYPAPLPIGDSNPSFIMKTAPGGVPFSSLWSGRIGLGPPSNFGFTTIPRGCARPSVRDRLRRSASQPWLPARHCRSEIRIHPCSGNGTRGVPF